MTTTTKDEALRMALEALEYHREQTRPIQQSDDAIAAIRAARDAPQPAADPPKEIGNSIPWVLRPTGRTIPDLTKREHLCEWQRAVRLTDASPPPAAPQPEPVAPPIVQQLADMVGGTITEYQALPDGSGFATMSMPLPSDHWLYAKADNELDYDPPPMPFRMSEGPERTAMANKIRAAAKYAIRGATMRGKDNDFDPDAMVQNMVVGMLGYWTEGGLSGDDWANPNPVPPLYASPPAREPLTEDQIARHTLKAGDCPAQSDVMLVSSIRRLIERCA